MGIIKINKEVLIGFLVSIFATACGFFIYLEYISPHGFYQAINLIKQNNVFSTIIALATLPNLFVFFIFLKKNQDLRARGVLMATIFIALITFILKILNSI